MNIQSISEDWTLEERVKVVLKLLPYIQDDIYANNYSAVGRPNITSVQSILMDDSSSLNLCRHTIQSFFDAQTLFARKNA